MTKEHLTGVPQPLTESDPWHATKEEILAAWYELPPEHQATMALVLLDTIMNSEWGLWVKEAIDTLWQVVYVNATTEAAAEESEEILDPRHFYAAYVFDWPDTRGQDIKVLINQAQLLGYPVRCWWLSQAMFLQDAPDRLIICVHHPSSAPDAGMDLYGSLTEQHVTWDDLDAAAMEEYCTYGQPITGLESIRLPGGQPLFE
jgi:hypothetical protein